MNQIEVFKALSNKTRLQILAWLKDPDLHFPDYKTTCDKESLGVCVGHIQQKAGLTQSTISEYLSLLQRAGLVTATRMGQWTYYKRNEAAFTALSKIISSDI
jgi:DNA-binding transcriptional ArsR family regulator